MSQIVKLRRSSVSGQKPTNSNLQLGELALNTTDGKVYMAKSGSLGPSVEELISTNTVNTGSIYLVGDITGSIFTGSFKGDGNGLYNIPLSGVTNLTTISSSIDNRLDILEAHSGSYSGSFTGSFSGSINARGQMDYLSFNTASTPSTQQYTLQANTTDRTLDLIMGNAATLQLGQEIYNPPVVNKSGGPLLDGDLVMINPAGIAQGNRISVVKAVADGTYPAEYILGVLTEDIAVNGEGFATWFGYVRNINKTHLVPAGETWVEGDILYPNSTIPGKMTNVMPVAPNLKSTIGIISNINGVNVTIMVRMSLRGKIDTLHNVNVGSTSNGDLLVRSGSIWKNSKSLNGNYTVTGSLTVTQNLTVLGSSSLVYVTSSNLAVSASFISVNVFEPAERFGGLKVYDSGSSTATASLAWDSLYNRWVYQNVSGSMYSGGMLLSGPRNSGSLGDEPSLISGRIVKSIGGDHIDVSIMSETGTTINVAGNLNAYSLTGSLNFGDLTDLPTLVSGSSQIYITGTTGYSTFSSSISTSLSDLSSSVSTSINNLSSSFSSSIGSLSSSIAITTNDLDGRLDSIEGVTGSYATTGSNYFYGDQTISGSLNVLTKVVTDELYVSGNVYFGTGDLNDRIVIKSWISSSIIPDSDGDHYLGQPLRRWAKIYSYTGSFDSLVGSGSQPIKIYDAIITGSATGSFKGDGSGLYNIPASGVTGLELNKIVSGNASASIDNNGLYVNRDVYIDGTITAKEIHTDYVTSSVLFQSGSTKFGNTYDDTHQFTGSLHISDESTNFNIVGNNFGQTYLQSPNGALVLQPGYGGVEVIGDNAGLKVNGNVIANTISGSFTGSGAGLYNLPYSGLTNVPTLVSSSSQISYTGITNIPNGIVSSSNQISFNGITDKPNLVSGSSQISFTGITDTPTLVSSSSQISYTGITNIPNGIVSGSQQVIDLGFTTTSSFNTFTSSYTTHSSSFDSRINAITGSIENITGSLSHLELFSSSINNFTSSVVLTSQTSSMTVLSSSYALTASYVINAGGGGTEGLTAKLEQTTPSTTWTFNHNLGEQFPAITIFDSNDNVVIPTSVNAQDSNTLVITFSSPQTGTASATVGGGLPYISSSFQGRVLAVDNGAPIWKSNIVSGSLQIFNFGYASTGSNVFIGDQHISGSLTVDDSAEIGSKCVTISSTTQIFDLSIFDGANFDYVVKNGLNMRAGVIMSAWNGSNSVYNESSTMDLGNTSGVTFNVTSTGKLNAVITNGSWKVQVLYRALGCGLLYPTPTPPNGTPTPTPTPTSTPSATSTPTPTPTFSPVGTNYMISATGSTAPNYCDGLSGPFTVSVYGDSAVWTLVTRFSTDSGMTIPFNGYSLYYADSGLSAGTTLQIDSSGYVINSYAC